MKNKIIILSYDYPPSNGGIARLTSEIAKGIVPYFEKVLVLTMANKSEQRSYDQNKDIETIRFSARRIKTEIEAVKYLKSIKNKNEYFLLCGLWHPEATLAYVSGFKEINVLTHGTELLYGTSKFRKYFWLKIYAKWILTKTNIIANSAYTAVLSKKVAPDASVTTLPLAVNHNYFFPNLSKKNNKLIIGTVSRIIKFKGHDFVLKVISNLSKEDKAHVEFHIAGTGPYLVNLNKLVKEYKLDDIVKFKGFVPDEELKDFYANLDLFILATRQNDNSTQIEGFGLVFLEAQSCGVPVIGTNTGGIPSAVEHGNGGWLIEQDNEEELSSLLKYLISNRQILVEQGGKARKRIVEKFTWRKYNNQLFSILI